ncbi:MAG: 3-deoxy-7-phosphoheptulonate synthase, partial [Lachnospiraceae bacterium]
EGLRYMQEAKQETGLATICEVVSLDAINAAVKYVDMIQIGARNMQNFYLLKEAGRSGLPVLLKRGLSATIDEWLNAAEYIIAEGNPNVVLCERGIRTFETATRNTLDMSAVPVLKEKTHLPVIVDPSHSTGAYRYVPSMAKAAVACGADGLMIEVHNDPANALSDGPQSLTFKKFDTLCNELHPFAALVERTF